MIKTPKLASLVVCILSRTWGLQAQTTVSEYTLPNTASNPTGIANGPDGNLWFTESATNKIGSITVNGTVTEFSIPTPNSQPWAITVGSDGNLWFTEIAANKIAKITTSGVIAEFSLPNTPIPGQPPKPNSIVAGPDGNLWFTSPDAGVIGRITISGVITEYRVALTNPAPITLGPDGSLWFTQAAGVGRITTSGTITQYPLVIGVRLDYLGLGAIEAGPDGNLWVIAGGLIWRISTSGVVTSYSVPDLGNVIFDYTTRGIAAGADGNLWFTGFSSNKIGSLTTGGVLTEYSIPSGSQAGGITAGPDGNIWFTETAGNSVAKLVLSTVPPNTLLSISPSTLTFTSVAPPNVAAPVQMLTVATSPSTTYTVSPTTVIGPSWLTISPSGDLVGSQSFTVAVNPKQFNFGTFGAYTGDITFISGSVTQIIPVTLNITNGFSAPIITEVDNAFSNIPNSPIQSGTWVAIKGKNLSNTSPGRGWNAGESFPASMDGTSVTINGKPAFLYFISPTQVNVQAPTDGALGPVSVVVINNGANSTAATATYQTNSPALLQWGGGQYPYALITNGATYIGNASVVQGTVSAHFGDSLTLWATGLGPTNPPLPAGQQLATFPPVTTTPTVTIGGNNVTVLGAVLRYAGLYQVNIQLPGSLPTGDLPIKIIQGSFQSPDRVLINVQP